MPGDILPEIVQTETVFDKIKLNCRPVDWSTDQTDFIQTMRSIPKTELLSYGILGFLDYYTPICVYTDYYVTPAKRNRALRDLRYCYWLSDTPIHLIDDAYVYDQRQYMRVYQDTNMRLHADEYNRSKHATG